jgi:membrane protein
MGHQVVTTPRRQEEGHMASDHPSGDRTSDVGGDRPTVPLAPDAGPASPAKLSGTSWWAALRRTASEFQKDNLTDLAAALTYYSVLSIFPGLLVLVSVLGLLGTRTTNEVQGTISGVVPRGEVRNILDAAINHVPAGGFASLATVFGLLAAFWSASGYIGAFMRASNAIYDVPEGRPIWKTLPIRLGVTAVIGLMLLASALIVVFTGRLAEEVGAALGIGSAAVTAWDIAKWPVLLVLVSLMFAILYWVSPNVRQGGFRWITPGGVLAVVVWLLASAGLALYVANFGSYNKTYGTLAGVIVFLIWLWLTNVAILIGAELNAELERGRAIAAGYPPDREPYLELRDDPTLRKTRRPPHE